MTDELLAEEAELPPEGPPPSPQRNFVDRVGGLGWLGPILTTILAFLIAGVAVAVIGKDPIKVYRGIFTGTGAPFFYHFGDYSIRLPFMTQHVWFWWDTASNDASNLQQTLLTTTPIILTALALSFAFRCGLFNIGGQGQYLVGSYLAVWIGTSFVDMNPFLHVVLCLVVGTIAGGAYAGIAGFLKATTGAHEVITTIMLNWIAIWVGAYLFGEQGPLQGSQKFTPVSNQIADGAKLPIFWGPKLLQGLSIGIFIAVAALFVYSILINRTTLGFEVRAVGFNPESARYGGISVARSYFLAMAIAGMFAGLGGALDITGLHYQIGELDIHASQIGFIGLAAALLGRNTAAGVGFASLLFGALLTGTSGRQLDPSVFPPELASDLTWIIQGLVVLFVGLDLTKLLVTFRRRRKAA
jgi:simple sugar transport system permease protein